MARSRIPASAWSGLVGLKPSRGRVTLGPDLQSLWPGMLQEFRSDSNSQGHRIDARHGIRTCGRRSVYHNSTCTTLRARNDGQHQQSA